MGVVANDLTDADDARAESTAQWVERSLAGARLRVLCVGAGIAGSTFAAVMGQRGEPVALIERGDETDSGGYMLGLMPLGGRVLNGLGLSQQYQTESLPMRTYVMFDRHGSSIRRYPLARVVEQFGDWRGIERGTLLAMLRSSAGSIRYRTKVAELADDSGGVTATFDDGSHVRVDLVVASDGIHSATRRLVLRSAEVDEFDTGWGGFVLWGPLDESQSDTYTEMWAAGWGVGLYPVPGRVGIFLAGRSETIATREADDYAEEIATRLPGGVLRAAIIGRDPDTPGVFWKMEDRRSKVWSRGHTVLLGDSAAAFLPTAGVGASAAMDSAAALADELSRAATRHMSYALQLYERRQRPRVERAQQNSRNLARFMFINGKRATFARDQIARFYSLDRLLADISKVMDGS